MTAKSVIILKIHAFARSRVSTGERACRMFVVDMGWWWGYYVDISW